jgi:putative peptidoglycan lipid II flippase
LTIALTRAVLPFLPMVAVAAAAMGMLNSLNHYFVPALSPAIFNAAMIACAVTFVPLMPALGGPRIMAIAIGALVGGVGQIAIQWPSLRREGFRYRPMFDPGDRGLRTVLLLMGPGTLGLAATQINTFVNTLLATSQGPGAVSWLTYAFRLMYLPIGLFAVSIGTAVLPAVSQHAARGDVAEMRRTIARGLALMLILNVPATTGLVILARPIVQLVFERGRFLPSDTDATAAALRVYACGLVGYSTARIVSPTFYALGQSRVPVAISAVAMGLNVVLNLTLVRIMGFRGLALGTSIAAIAHAAILVSLLRGRLQGIDGMRLLRLFVKIGVASGVMAAVAAPVHSALAQGVAGSGVLVQSVRLGAAIILGLLALAAGAKLLAIAEFTEALTVMRLQVRKLLDRK